jgi:hypothetical protein
MNIGSPGIYVMWEATSINGFVSKHDSLVSHIGLEIDRERGSEIDKESVHHGISIGLRS